MLSRGTAPRFLCSKQRSFLLDLAPDRWRHVGVDTDERDYVVDESELDVPTRRQPSLQVPAHTQIDKALDTRGRRSENVPAELRTILAAPDAPHAANGGGRQRAQAAIACRGGDDS
jgi:hypothetical protein